MAFDVRCTHWMRCADAPANKRCPHAAPHKPANVAWRLVAFLCNAQYRLCQPFGCKKRVYVRCERVVSA